MMLINDFSEIEDEKDRELYVSFRQILDGWFLTSIQFHNEHEDHKLHQCVKTESDESRKTLDLALKTFKTDDGKKDYLDKNITHQHLLMIGSIQNLIILKQKFES